MAAGWKSERRSRRLADGRMILAAACASLTVAGCTLPGGRPLIGIETAAPPPAEPAYHEFPAGGDPTTVFAPIPVTADGAGPARHALHESPGPRESFVGYSGSDRCARGECGLSRNGRGHCHSTDCPLGCARCRGAYPRELSKVSLPDYVIEPPDILLLEATNSLRPPDALLRSGEVLEVRVANTIPIDGLDDEVTRAFKQINGLFPIQTDGTISFGPEYGSVPVRGLTPADARRLIELHLKQTLRDPQVFVRLVSDDARQHVSGEHLVRPDGTVSLGVYGSVYVAGLTLNQARAAIEQHLAKSLHQPEVTVDVLAYNSKVFYVVTDGGGAGEQVFRFPCTGNETVLDALSEINGLPPVASKKHIWIARPAPPELGYEQVLEVDWNSIVQGGQSATNYQILPGDRVYVRADDLITFDTAVAKLTAPLERILGFVLLGHGTVRAVQFGHRFNGGGSGSTP